MEAETGFLMDEPTWSQRVKALRLKLDITQIGLAALLDMSEAGVAAWEMRSKRPWSEESERFLVLESETEEEDIGVS